MMAFQQEPDHVDEPTKRCDRCHNVVFVDSMKNTSEGDPYCPTCGYVFGTSVAPSTWVCEECSETVLHHGGDERPWCESCKLPMSCCHASPSGVHGIGLGAELDLGLSLCLESEEILFETGKRILEEILEGTNITTGN